MHESGRSGAPLFMAVGALYKLWVMRRHARDGYYPIDSSCYDNVSCLFKCPSSYPEDEAYQKGLSLEDI